MPTSENTTLAAEGESLVRRLFEIATVRLQQRKITLEYTPSVIDWLLDQPDWQNSLNPLRTLDGALASASS